MANQLAAYAQVVSITTTDSKVRLGTYLHRGLSTCYFPFVFSSAAALNLELDKDCVYEDAYDSDDSSTDIDEEEESEEELAIQMMGKEKVGSNIAGFIDFCKQRLPRMKEARVSMGKKNGYWHRDLHVLTQKLLELCTQSPRSSLSLFFWDYPECLLHPGSIGLTNLDIAWHSDSKAAQVAVNNAQTLQSLRLDIGAFALENTHELFGSSKDVVYPHLKKLHIDGAQDKIEAREMQNADPGYVPFPGLGYLYIGIHYPVASSLFFRGNAHALEYLHVTVDPVSLGIMTSVFANINCLKLRHACFPLHSKFNRSVSLTGSDTFELKHLITMLPKYLHTLKLSSNDHISQSIVSGLSQQRHLRDLQVLHLNCVYIGLQDLCSVLKQLPSLRSLCIASIRMEKMYENRDLDLNVNKLGQQFGPLGKHLTRVTAHGLLDSMLNADDTIKQFANCCLVLSKLCGRRLAVDVDSEIQQLFYSYYDKSLLSPGKLAQLEQCTLTAGFNLAFLMQSLVLRNNLVLEQ
ncbi:hypothetical protein GGF39_001466 [Coemansia sp. RSA 1721]|nr:hypothetical protein GGF39_001466 [Coemansia sp. RSA 1721]